MKRQKGFGAGGASVLVVFVVLCLTAFAALSLVSAQADLRLSQRAAQTLAGYYEADYAASALFAHLSGAVETVSPARGEEAYLALCGERLLSQLDTLTLERSDGLVGRFSVPIDERRALSAAFRVVYPPPQNGPRLALLEWKTVDTAEWTGDEGVGVWQGGKELLG